MLDFFFLSLLMSQRAHSPQTDLKRPFKVMERDHTLPWVGGKETGYEGETYTENLVS